MKFICPHADICPSAFHCEHQMPHNKNTLCTMSCLYSVDNSDVDVDVGVCVDVLEVYIPEELFEI